MKFDLNYREHINKTKQMELATLIVVVLLGALCIMGTIQIIRILFKTVNENNEI